MQCRYPIPDTMLLDEQGNIPNPGPGPSLDLMLYLLFPSPSRTWIRPQNYPLFRGLAAIRALSGWACWGWRIDRAGRPCRHCFLAAGVLPLSATLARE
jgi:hypothetical protein